MREAFAKSNLGAQFRGIVEAEAFIEASKIAMLTFTEQHCGGADSAQAAANNYRIEGAKMFLADLKAIADETAPRKPLRSAQLNHSLK